MALVDEYCLSCHDETEKKAGLALDVLAADVSQQPDVWEKVVRKLRARQMPPVGRKERPDEAMYDSTVAYLETAISDLDGELVSKGTGTFFVRRKADSPPREAAS